MNGDAPERRLFVLPLADIDPPQLDARINRDPEKLEDLARDILRRGVIEPIKVVRAGVRFEVVDGHRRYLASKSAGLATIEAFVYESKGVWLEGVKYAATQFHEDFSPADEAIYFNQLLIHECDGDIERLAAVVGRKLSYLDNRLSLLAGDELVFEALRARDIKIGVAHQLNKVTNAEYRRYYLKHAVLEGSTESVVAGWVEQWRQAIGDRPASAAPAAAASGPTLTPAHDPHRCYICHKSDPRFVPETLSVHSHCRLAILDPLLSSGQPIDETFEAAAQDPRRV